MRKEMKWRYYCDFCKKSGASGGAMKTHEKHCTMNPDRKCRTCDLIELVQPPIAELMGALVAGGTAAIIKLMDGECPACILSAIRQHKATLTLAPATFEPFIPADEWPGSDYDYKSHMKSIMDDTNREYANR